MKVPTKNKKTIVIVSIWLLFKHHHKQILNFKSKQGTLKSFAF